MACIVQYLISSWILLLVCSSLRLPTCPEIPATYNVSSGTLNPTVLYHT